MDSWIPYSCQYIDEADCQAVLETLTQPYLTQGPKIAAFEDALAKYVGTKHAIAVSNGTAALHLACLALNLGPNSAGVTAPISFAASANCLLYVGANVHFADVDPMSGLITPESAESAIQEAIAQGAQSGVLIPVSLKGETPDLPALQSIAKKYNWSVIEDAAHSLGATYTDTHGQSFKSASCAHTDLAITSFHPLKAICSGEGGAIFTNDDALAESLRLLRSHGIKRFTESEPLWDEKGDPAWSYDQVTLGYNYRMTDFQAALGLSQLAKLDDFLAIRRQRAQNYYEQIPQSLPFAQQTPNSSYHVFVVHFPDAQTRNHAHRFLKEKKILSQVHYVPIYRLEHYRKTFGPISRPGAEAYYEGALSIPLSVKMTDADQSRVLTALHEFSEQHMPLCTPA